MNNNLMTKEEMDAFLESIGGLKSGFFSDRPPIVSANVFSIDAGWYGIVKRLIEDLIELGWNKEICQVKEKFGSLRFYVGSCSTEIFNRIMQAEAESCVICERCGKGGQLRGGGWLATLCEEHADGRPLFQLVHV